MKLVNYPSKLKNHWPNVKAEHKINLAKSGIVEAAILQQNR